MATFIQQKAGEDMERNEPLFSAGGDANTFINLMINISNQFDRSLKKVELLYDLFISLCAYVQSTPHPAIDIDTPCL